MNLSLFMTSSDLFNGFCISRNIKGSTVRSYLSAVRKYESYNGMSMDSLMDEAIRDEESMVPLKNRHIKNRLLNFRSYLLDSELSINTVKTYFSRIKTFYRHFAGRSVPFHLMLLGRLFFSFQAVAVPRQKPFPLLSVIL